MFAVKSIFKNDFFKRIEDIVSMQHSHIKFIFCYWCAHSIRSTYRFFEFNFSSSIWHFVLVPIAGMWVYFRSPHIIIDVCLGLGVVYSKKKSSSNKFHNLVSYIRKYCFHMPGHTLNSLSVLYSKWFTLNEIETLFENNAPHGFGTEPTMWSILWSKQQQKPDFSSKISISLLCKSRG